MKNNTKEHLKSVFIDGNRAIRLSLQWYDKYKKCWHKDEDELLHKFIKKTITDWDMFLNCYVVNNVQDLIDWSIQWKNLDIPIDPILQDQTRKVECENIIPLIITKDSFPSLGYEFDKIAELCVLDFCKKKKIPCSFTQNDNGNLSLINMFDWLENDICEYVDTHKLQKKRQLNI